ncbi:hypothetical protein MSLAZ_2081 [Methanosarcina lacustris Z-7289]|uniref:Uncharacterized protein n=1 Tax=Methanosarcina lacustris Z-7289 TaxID=1434111 RepID=A0A0E3S7F6_9EURY|nr:hypothetical protein MSLAZ_2081 [Methanosarcina lacustris Z-7289]
MRKVSILVLLEAVFQQQICLNLKSTEPKVSILVLLEAVFQLEKAEELVELGPKFQSLFCWKMFFNCCYYAGLYHG